MKKHKTGILARSDFTGLGNQTRNLSRMLNPDKIMIVNSKSFNGNEQHPEWYEGRNYTMTKGWPSEMECARFMQGLTHLITAETVYNNHIFWLAKKYGVKIFIQPNWEFLDHLNKPLPQPHKWLMPSYWHLDDMKNKFPNTVYLPPPLFFSDFEAARNENLELSSERRLLHVVGKAASYDRNGTKDLIAALKHSTAQYKLVIQTQFPLEGYDELLADPRVELRIENVVNEADMYKGYDAMIMPRRYGGLCLPMNEALASSLPIIMPDISPNNKVLPAEWLVPANITDTFVARVPIDVHTTSAEELGKKMDEFATMSESDLLQQKALAYEIAQREYSHEGLEEKYKQVMGIM